MTEPHMVQSYAELDKRHILVVIYHEAVTLG